MGNSAVVKYLVIRQGSYGRVCGRRSVTRSAAAATAADAFDDMVFLEVLLRHTADAGALEVGLLRLDASQAAQLLYVSMSIQTQKLLCKRHTFS